MAIWLIAQAGLKRKKGVAISTGLLIVLSVAILNMGITLLIGIGSFYDRANDQLNGADYVVRFASNEYKDEYLDFFLNDSRVSSAQTEEIITMDTATYPQGGAISISFLQMDQKQAITGFKVQKYADVPKNQAVYVPEYFRKLGYEPGDPIVINYNKQTFTFYIEGYSQSTWLHSSVTSLANFYLPRASYESLYSQVGGGYLLSVQVHNPDDISPLRKDFRDKTDVKIESPTMNANIMDFTLEEMKNGSTIMISILSSILVAFATLIVMVSMLVIRFRISNHIETQMHNIGALGAMGYTGKQIRQSIALEFFVLGLAGSLMGIILSYGMTAALASFITQTVGIKWQANAHILTDILSAGSMTLIILLVSHVSAAKAAKILPVQALRKGMHSHSFAKNHIPLENTRFGLTVALGLKQTFFQLKTHLTVSIIFSGVAFALLSTVVIFMNMGVDQELIVAMTGYETSDVLVYPAPHADYDKLVSDLQDLGDVKKTSLFETTSVSLGDELLTCYISDDYSNLENVYVYEGSLPVYDNEIVLTGVLAKLMNKQVGDYIEIKINGVSSDFIICGLTQTMSNFGRQCYLTLEGLLRLNPTYQKKSIQVYLNPGITIDSFIADVEQNFNVLSPSMNVEVSDQITAKQKAEEALTRLLTMYETDSAQFALMKDGEIILSGDTSSYQIEHLENNRNLLISNINSFSDASAIIALNVLIGALLIIILVFYMIIKSMLIRRSREFGIYKANGYTNRQLMAQIAVSFMPSVILGTLLGYLLAYTLINPLSSILFQGLGVSRMNFNLYPVVLAVTGVLLIVCSLLICMAMAWKIRKITVYTLLAE